MIGRTVNLESRGTLGGAHERRIYTKVPKIILTHDADPCFTNTTRNIHFHRDNLTLTVEIPGIPRMP